MGKTCVLVTDSAYRDRKLLASRKLLAVEVYWWPRSRHQPVEDDTAPRVHNLASVLPREQYLDICTAVVVPSPS